MNGKKAIIFFSLSSTATTTSSSTTAAQSTTSSSRSPLGPTTWSADGVQYQVGDMVFYDGVKYECVHAHTSFPGAEPGILTWALWKPRA